MIHARGLRAGYRDREVLRGIDLDLAAGEWAGLLGPNGSGKTTLLLALSGVLAPASGSIEVNGRPLATMKPRERARLLACVPQRAERPAGLTGLDLALMGRYPRLGLLADYSGADRDAARHALAEAGAEGLAHRPVQELSGGEFQRVLLARALAQEAPCLLLDEAASALDPAARVDIHDLLAHKSAAGACVLTAAHDLNLAALYCPRLLFLKEGRVVLDGPTADVFTEKTLSEIYETRICVAPHPVTGAPQAHPVPGAGLAPDRPGLRARPDR